MINYKSFDIKLAEIESRYTYKSDDIYYFNVHRPKNLILRLQRRVEYFDQKLVPVILKYALGEDVNSFEISKYFGTGHIIIFVNIKGDKKLVLRTNLFLSEPEHYMDMEQDFSNLYKSVGIPSTIILFSDTTRKVFPFDCQIMEYLSGKDLEQEWEGTKEEYDKISYQMGVNTAKLYNLPLKGWGRLRKDESGSIYGVKNSAYDYLTSYIVQDIEILKLFNFVSPSEIDILTQYFLGNTLKDLFSDEKQGYLLLHDPSDHNMRYEKDRISAVFDWENAVSYDPVCEVGSAPTWKTHFPRKEIMTKGFIDTLGYTPVNFKQKAAVHFLRKIVDKVQFALKGERLSQRHVDIFNQACKDNELLIESKIEI